MTKPKRPRDTNQLAKFIVDRSVGEVQEPSANDGKDALAVERGRRGGLKGGRARADKMTDEERRESAARAARARWSQRG